MQANVIFGYAIYDAENTTRLSEQPAEVQSVYFARGDDLLHALTFRTKAELTALAESILELKH